MDDVDVSVVLPTRDRLPMLQRALASVLRQDVGLEVLVVDEASSDGTPQWLASLDDPRVRVIRHDQPKGVAAARNAGIQAASGPWLAFLDDDDLWAPDKLAAQLSELERSGRAQWATCGVVSFGLDGVILREDDAPPDGDVSSLLLASNRVPAGPSSVLARTALVRSLGGFDESLSSAADWELWIRLALSSPLTSVHRPLVAYRVHPTSMSTDLGLREREDAKVAAKHAAARRARSVELDVRRIELWTARAHERAGRRLAPARTYARWAVRRRELRLLLDAVGAAAAPRRASRRRDAAKSSSVREAWRTEVQAWLGTAP